jgi:poly-beta-1,6 N-acetyl-D-glucosamine synthase
MVNLKGLFLTGIARIVINVMLLTVFFLSLYTVVSRFPSLPNIFTKIAFVILLVFLLTVIFRYLFFLWLSFIDSVESSVEELPPGFYPKVSIIVPAYCEGVVIQESIKSLLKQDYENLEIIVVDDGSSDDTYVKAKALEGRHGGKEVKVFTKPNGGKARALNFGISLASGEFVLCIDADSVLEPQTVREMVKHFYDLNVGAVAGYVGVINRVNMWTKLQALEYIEGLNMVRKAQAFLRLVNIIPGPVGMFRKEAVIDIGGYHTDTFAEDCDLTLRLLEKGWKIKYEPLAVAWTEAPEEILNLIKQRYRWTRGILQAIRKHSPKLLELRKHPAFSMTLWYMFFEAVIWPFMDIFANVFFIFLAFQYGLSIFVAFWWVLLTVVDVSAAFYCVVSEKEDLTLVFYAILYRLFYIIILDIAKVFATIEEWRGVGMNWGKLERKGRLSQ